MIVGILEVNIRSVFLHQDLDNAVVAIERGYLNSIKSVLGDEIRLDILRLQLLTKKALPILFLKLTFVSMRTVTMSSHPC